MPPKTLPFLSAMTVIIVTHRHPTAKAKVRCKREMLESTEITV
jgi:hypothetical protein